ncbi:upper zone of growth plate and cartilage matrix associated a [Pristis pectinata]|uniref:upper zone of growth plate and cartilage matrix associated a n=1 Tax=Pristis pectinata TaxID=685728 RepID=UPI00223DE989|nr:upper zone of growth plate and cartilage matrix associated a [Pristis pectinata]
MQWKRLVVLSCAATGVLLAVLSQAEGAAVRADGGGEPQDSESSKRRVFMSEENASTFLKRRTRRSTRAELAAEHRQRLAADERRKEYHEEQLYEWENYVEEEQDEQYERNRERVESWRQWHYDGLYPSYQYNRYIY